MVNPGPHGARPPAYAGAALEEAVAAILLVHGRGASAAGMLDLARHFFDPRIAYLAPEAAGGTWYPHSFLAPLAMNEPGLSSALATLDATLQQVLAAGLPPERVLLLGFSQGACLTLEFAARRPTRYGGVVGLSGGLIGNAEIPGASPPADKAFAYAGAFEGCPVLLACSAADPHIPAVRVQETAGVLEGLGASVETRIYPGASHTVRLEEIEAMRGLMATLVAGA